jgi:hypothetical protein
LRFWALHPSDRPLFEDIPEEFEKIKFDTVPALEPENDRAYVVCIP